MDEMRSSNPVNLFESMSSNQINEGQLQPEGERRKGSVDWILCLVFDCCFTTDAWEEENYKVYIGGIVGQLGDHIPDASILVFNFHEGDGQSQIANFLSDFDMAIMDYHRQNEGCPLLTMEVIHHFLRSSESWLSLGPNNLLLMHYERGGWPILAFMLAALLIYRKHYTGEQKTLDMIYKQSPRELLQFLSPLNPLPSQLRYLQYTLQEKGGIVTWFEEGSIKSASREHM